MTRFLTFTFVAVLLTVGTTSALRPADSTDTVWIKKWAERSKSFSAQRDHAKAVVIANFDSAIVKVDSQKSLTPAAKTDRRKELQEAKQTFEKTGAFPTDEDFVASQFEYALKVNKAATPLTVLIDEIIAEGTKTKDDTLEKQGLKMKEDLEKQLGGASRLVGNSLWQGELRQKGGNTIPYHLYVAKMGEGGLFRGHVEDNPGVQGNWSYDVEGQTRALGMEYKMTKIRRGGFTAVAVSGIVSGDRLIAKITSVVGKGKSASSVIVLKRVK